jgi:hypothetical protein
MEDSFDPLCSISGQQAGPRSLRGRARIKNSNNEDCGEISKIRDYMGCGGAECRRDLIAFGDPQPKKTFFPIHQRHDLYATAV